MAARPEFESATINRSIRSIKAELAFLADSSVLSPSDLSQILTQLPSETPMGAPIPLQTIPISSLPRDNNTASPAQSATNGIHNLSINDPEKRRQTQQQDQPPAYPSTSPYPPPTPTPSFLCQATALYAYPATDAGDLALSPDDSINVVEYTNAEWWKGVSTRTGAEGIFPRSYVRVEEAKAPQQENGGGYGNVPLEVSQQGGGSGMGGGKGAEMGKKFGRKLGNAAIFGAGATMGSDLVNSIF